MRGLLANIILAIVLALCGIQPAMPQEADIHSLADMEKGLDSLSGYPKARLLIEIANGYEYISITQSMYYCQLAIEEFEGLSGQDAYDPNKGIFNEPDSLLDLRAEAYYILGKCHININEESTFENREHQSSANKSNKNHALEDFKSMLLIRQHQGDPAEIAKAINCLAVTLTTLNQTDSAMALYKRNISTYQQIDDKHGLAQTYNNIALILAQDHKTVEKSNSYFRMALRFAEDDGDDNIFIQASCNLADNCSKRGNLTMAYKYLSDAVPVCQKTHNYVNLNMIYMELSRVLFRQEEYKEAYEYLEKYNKLKDTIVNLETLRQVNELRARYDANLKENQITQLTNEHQEDSKTLMRHKIWIIVVMVLLAIAIAGVLKSVTETRRKNRTNQLLSKANESINNSLNYASRLQKIIITGERMARDILSDYFVFHRPKNIVSGDFYYVRDFGSYLVVAVADCTGHGVPAAFLSVLNITFFNEIFNNQDTAPDPGMVLDGVRTKTIKALDQTDDLSSSTDGMDCGLLIVDKEKGTAEFAGGYIDLYISRADTGKIEVVRSTHNPVCWYFKQMPFKTQQISLEPNDIIYLFSDGYADQVDPSHTEKYTKKRLRETLEQMHDLDLQTQKSILARNMDDWKKNAEQIDDILILGIRADSLLPKC